LNVKRNVAIAAPATAVDLDTLLEGNAYTDYSVNFYDFSVLAAGWQTYQEDIPYDEWADFDRNGVINILDLFLLCNNWLEASPIEVP
jgi:hypothetical protein